MSSKAGRDRAGGTLGVVALGVAAASAAATGTAMLQHRRACALPAGPVEARFSARGPHEVRRSALSQRGLRDLQVWRPAVPADEERRSPIVTWGNGSRATPEHYVGLLEHLASWGIVVVASTSDATATGVDQLEALDRLFDAAAVPGSLLHERLDDARVAAAGHSQGAGGSVNATRRSGGAIGATVTFALPRRRWVSAGDEYEPGELTGPVLLLTGTADIVVAGPVPTRAYFEEIPGPAVTASLRGAGHNEIQGTGGRYLGVTTAWLRAVLFEDRVADELFGDGVDHGLSVAPRWTDVAIRGDRQLVE